MSNQTNATNHATELFIEDLGRVSGGTCTTAGAEGGNPHPTTMTLVGTEGGNGPDRATTMIAGEEGSQGLPSFPGVPNFPDLTKTLGEGFGGPITQMAGEGGGGPMKL